MARTTAVVEQQVSALSCDVCRKVYAKGSVAGSSGPIYKPEGCAELQVHTYRNSRPAFEMCPECAGIIWDMIQERVLPDPNAKPEPPPRPIPPEVPPVVCGSVIVVGQNGHPNVLCVRWIHHVGMHSSNLAARDDL